jgi:uncharacterized protein (TIGR03086 family)
VADALARYQTVATGFTARLHGVAPDQWSTPTPCPDWTVRDLVAHVVGTQRAVLSRLDDAEPDPVDAAGDLTAQWGEASDGIVDALGDQRATTVVGGMFGEQTFASLVTRLVCTDALVHTWDLARATGQDERLDPDAVVASLEFLTPVDDAIRRPGGFAAKIEPAAGADDQTRFLNFCGRAP